MSNNKIIQVIYGALAEVNEQLPRDKKLALSLETRIWGSGSGLDSLGFVNFIVALEQKLQNDLGAELVMAENEELLDFTTVEDLAGRLKAILEKSGK